MKDRVVSLRSVPKKKWSVYRYLVEFLIKKLKVGVKILLFYGMCRVRRHYSLMI